MKIYNLSYFQDKNWSFVLIKKDKIVYRSKKQGLLPLIFCLKRNRQTMKGALVFDKIIGRAAALLLIYARVKKIMTPVITMQALKILRKNKTKVNYGKIIVKVLNKKGRDLCPMEKLSQGKSAKEFYKMMIKN